jgi:hypothetical protein
MNCVKCGDEIPAGRLKALPGAKTCVSCSSIKKKGVVTLMKGEGDHTWIETIHLDHSEYVKYMEEENKSRKKSNISLDDIDTPTDIPYGFSEKKLDKKDEE